MFPVYVEAPPDGSCSGALTWPDVVSFSEPPAALPLFVT